MCISPVVDRLKEDEGEEGEGEQTSRRTRPEKQCRSNTTSACLDGKIIAKKEAKPCSHQTSQPHPNPPFQQGKGGQQRHSSTLGAGNIAKPWFVAPTPDWTDVRQGGGDGRDSRRSRGRWTLERGTEKGDTVVFPAADGEGRGPLGQAGYRVFFCVTQGQREMMAGQILGTHDTARGERGGERGSCTRSTTTTKGDADDPASTIDMLLHPALEYPATAGSRDAISSEKCQPVPCACRSGSVRSDGFMLISTRSVRFARNTPSPSVYTSVVDIIQNYMYRENASRSLLTSPPHLYAMPFPGTHSIRPPNLSIQVRIQKAIVGIQLAKRMLREQHIRRRPLCRAPVGFSQRRPPSMSHGKQTYTVKQSSINAIAIGEISSRTSSGMGGASPLAIL